MQRSLRVCYPRILLKLSGEALIDMSHSAQKTDRMSSAIISRIAKDIGEIASHQVEVGIVIGGGNWFRGPQGASIGLSRITSDYVGMLATGMNALILQDFLMAQGLEVRIISAGYSNDCTEAFELMRVRRYLKEGKIVIFSGGIGHPFVSTDAAASLRALEIEADILLKATTVDGIYDDDPNQNAQAKLYTHLSYREVLEAELNVMDLAAFIQCRDYNLPIRVFNMNRPQAIIEIIQGKLIGTLVDHKTSSNA